MDGMANSGAKPLTHGPRRLALRHAADAQSLLYLVALPAIVGWQWVNGLVWWLYGIALFLTFAWAIGALIFYSVRDRR